MVLSRLSCLARAVLLVACLPGDARADGDADRNAAVALADAGLVLLHRGDPTGAFDLFTRASALVPAPTFSLYEARCLVALGRLDEAEQAYERAERFDDGPTATPTQRLAVSEARYEHAALRRKRERPRALTASTPARPAAGSASAAAAPPPAPDHRETTRKPGVGALVALGAGAAGLTVGVVAGLVMLSRKSELDDACPNGRCPASASDTLDSYRTARTVSTVAWGVGFAGLGVGAGLWIAGPRPDQAPSSTVVVLLGPGTASLRGTF